MTTKTEALRTLNDELRQNLSPGTALMTAGVAALGAEAVARIVKTIEVYDNFCHANDPYEEHDFGSFEADGHTIFFKIDYFDSTLTVHSPDPGDPTVTECWRRNIDLRRSRFRDSPRRASAIRDNKRPTTGV